MQNIIAQEIISSMRFREDPINFTMDEDGIWERDEDGIWESFNEKVNNIHNSVYNGLKQTEAKISKTTENLEKYYTGTFYKTSIRGLKLYLFYDFCKHVSKQVETKKLSKMSKEAQKNYLKKKAELHLKNIKKAIQDKKFKEFLEKKAKSISIKDFIKNVNILKLIWYFIRMKLLSWVLQFFYTLVTAIILLKKNLK